MYHVLFKYFKILSTKKKKKANQQQCEVCVLVPKLISSSSFLGDDSRNFLSGSQIIAVRAHSGKYVLVTESRGLHHLLLKLSHLILIGYIQFARYFSCWQAIRVIFMTWAHFTAFYLNSGSVLVSSYWVALKAQRQTKFFSPQLCFSFLGLKLKAAMFRK